MTIVLTQPTKENSIFSLHAHIRTLQSDNKNLQNMLRDKLIHLNAHFNTNQHLQSRLIQAGTHFKQEQTDIHELNSNNLIVTQISLQEESEMKEIIENYQKRILELQSSLIAKQDEIIEQVYEGERQMAPRRENIQVLNKDSHQKMTIKRALQDLKKLKVEIEALEYSLNAKTQKSAAKIVKTLSAESKNQNKQSSQNSKGKDKTDEIYRDKLLDKVRKMLEMELARQQNLKKQISQLKIEWNCLSNQHQHLIANFKKRGNHRIINIDTKILNNKNDEPISFLDQLYRAETGQVKQNLFAKIDQNVKSQKRKSQKKNTASKEKCGKIDKEN